MKRAFTLSFLVGIMSFTYLLSAQNIDKRSITGSWLGKIAAGENLAAINKALKSGGNNSVKTIKLPDLNHLFQHCKSGLPAEYGNTEETFSPEVLKIMADWILSL